jgi:hypothetical protein
MLKLSAAGLFLLASAAGLAASVWPASDPIARADDLAPADQPVALQSPPVAMGQMVGGPRIVFSDGSVVPLALQQGGPVTVYAGAAGNVVATLTFVAHPSFWLPNGWFQYHVRIGPDGGGAYSFSLTGVPRPLVTGGAVVVPSGPQSTQKVEFTIFEN